MGQKVVRLIGLVFLAVVVFKVVLHQSAAQSAALNPDSQNQFQPGSAVSETQIEITRVVYVTATPQPASETAVQGEAEALKVISRTPEKRREADVQPTFQLTFNKAVLQQVRQRLVEVEPAVSLSYYWEEENILLVRPDLPLNPENTYTFSLSPELEAVDGSTLTSDYSWEYVPQPLIEADKYQTLPDGRGSFQFRFHYPVEPTSVVWQISPYTEGDLVWSEDFKRLTFEGQSPFLSGETYVVDLGQVLYQPNGLPVPVPAAIDFPISGLTASLTPGPGVNNVTPFTTIELRFRREVNQAVVEAGVVIEPEPIGEPAFRWEGDILMADVFLSPDQQYTVRIDTSHLLDEQGRRLSAEEIVWSFRTGDAENVAGFGSGPRIQTLQVGRTPDERPAVEYSFPDRQPPVPVTFELYEMAFSDWLAVPTLSEHEIDGQVPLATWQEAAPSDTGLYFVSNQTLLPENLLPGFYRLRLSAYGAVQDELALIITDLALAFRVEDDRLLAWVVDLETLTPVSAELTVFQGGEQLASAQTDSNGLASLILEELLEDNETPIMVAARAGEQFTMAAYNYGWYSYSSYGTERPDYFLHLTTDRPLYHPGETAYLRAILRANENGAPAVVAPGQTLTVTVYGYSHPVGYVEAEEPAYLVTNQYGTAHGGVVIPADFAAGQYQASVEYKGISVVQSFEVAEPQAETAPIVTVSTPMIIGQGEMLDITVEVKDSSGRPLADQAIEISYLYPAGDWNGCYWSSGLNEWYQEDEAVHAAQTDGSGLYTYSIPAEMGYNSHAPYSDSNLRHSIMAVVAKVDFDRTTGTGFSVVEIAGAAEELKWQPSSMVQAAGQPFVVQGTVHDLTGAPVAGRVVTAAVREAGEYGISADSEAGVTIFQAQSSTDANGLVTFDLTVTKPGYYDLRLAGQDRLGNEMVVFRPLYVTGQGEAAAIPALKLGLARRDNYAGQSAQLVILADQPGPALLTLANRSGIRNELINLSSQVNVIELPLTAADSPALNIQVDLWQPETPAFDRENFETVYSRRDGNLLTTSLIVNVIDLDKQLQLSILESDGVNADGQTAVTVQVLNGRGQPVSAEVTLSIAGQALYRNFPDHNRPQYSSLFRQVTIDQTVYHSLAPRRDLSYQFFGGCGCGGGWWGDERLPSPANHLPSFWFPGLQTDHNGQATVFVTLPDNPDGWHFSAQAITADGQVGEVSE